MGGLVQALPFQCQGLPEPSTHISAGATSATLPTVLNGIVSWLQAAPFQWISPPAPPAQISFGPTPDTLYSAPMSGAETGRHTGPQTGVGLAVGVAAGVEVVV